ncbi:MAG: histone deacetylase [Candidatus Altiarchaeales archaeon]|nr:histone deacetylase [Candidatus Altiarchaeales archaeon]MBD3417290.1 histone deacetylase [Candidatus Altiarchaeales archaeon]
MSTGLVYHKDFVKHCPYPGNPEVPERVTATYDHFREAGLLDKLALLTPEPCSPDDITMVHSREHYDYVEYTSETGYPDDAVLNTDVYVCGDTCYAALLAAGGVMLGGESVWKGEVDNCFGLVRPPGHHAGLYRPAGFCYFNNTAITIKHLQQAHGLGRVAVFDWDAHCGNGTMEVFYDDPSVLTISAHQDPRSFYPGTGFVEQRGEGEGEGYCLNIPLQAGAGDADFMRVIEELVVPKVREFGPDMLFVGAGQDSHRDDIISGLQVTDEGYSAMTAGMMELAGEVCNGRLFLVLEGGYNLEKLPKTHETIVKTLMGEADAPEMSGTPLDSTVEVIDRVKHLPGTEESDLG